MSEPLVDYTARRDHYFHLLPSSTDIDLKKASKCFAQHFSCGSSVTGDDEIVVQGDVYDDLAELVQQKWPQVSP